MYSVNVPVPSAVRELVADLRPALIGFDHIRAGREQTLVVKRLPADDRRELLDAKRRARRVLQGAPTFEARVTDFGVFQNPPNGSSPVVYLAVESPGLRRIHQDLVEEFDAVPQMEGDEYDPHITLARDGDQRAVDRVLERDFDPITWTVEEIEFYDANYHERIEAVPLPA